MAGRRPGEIVRTRQRRLSGVNDIGLEICTHFAFCEGVRPVYAGPSQAPAKDRFGGFSDQWAAVPGDHPAAAERQVGVRSVPGP